MSSTERNPISEYTQEPSESVLDHKTAGEHSLVGEGRAARQESRHVTPLMRCQCGCGRLLDSLGRGTPRKYATPACRTRAWRRRREPCAGAPSTTPASGTGQDKGRLAG